MQLLGLNLRQQSSPARSSSTQENGAYDAQLPAQPSTGDRPECDDDNLWKQGFADRHKQIVDLLNGMKKELELIKAHTSDSSKSYTSQATISKDLLNQISEAGWQSAQYAREAANQAADQSQLLSFFTVITTFFLPLGFLCQVS